MRREDLPSVRKTLRDGWHFLVPVARPDLFPGDRAGFARSRGGLGAAVLRADLARARARRGPPHRASRIVEAFDESSRSAVMIAVACAVVGIIMNVTDLTGLGLKFTSLIIGYSNDTLSCCCC